jgi:4-hydroxy-tetrahydrodipicolinate reductase
MIKIAVSGSKGRMGGSILRLAGEDPDITVASAFDVGDDPRAAIEKCDILIDFTAPAATMENLKIAGELKKGVVIGTTGISDDKAAIIKETAASVPVVYAPNMAIGVNVFFKLVKDVSSLLKSFGISITETHHVHKKDAPSGTAKKMHQIASQASGIAAADIPVASKREGEVVGDHTIVLDGKEERLELTHHAKSRDVFARGALTAAKFLADKKKGLYGMDKVLGI